MKTFFKFLNFKRLSILVMLIVIWGCKKDPKNLVKHLNGYWEIENVELANGNLKTYSINETIDFISIDSTLKGFRKKLKPGINNTYYTSKDEEAITLLVTSNSITMQYSTPFSQWKETVLFADENHLKLINANKDVYLYKRYIPLHLN